MKIAKAEFYKKKLKKDVLVIEDRICVNYLKQIVDQLTVFLRLSKKKKPFEKLISEGQKNCYV